MKENDVKQIINKQMAIILKLKMKNQELEKKIKHLEKLLISIPINLTKDK